jgi:hypothetical protein
MDEISDAERQRIAELLAEGAPVWRLHKEINRSGMRSGGLRWRCTVRRSGSRDDRR